MRLVATSRERLRVAGEQLCTVPTLATSADGDAPAVQLFVERARAVAPGLRPDAGELAAIAEIVRRLDGLPLAIELAAARLHTLDVAEVAAGLDRRFLLLSSGYRTSSRHGSLDAAVSWSFDLLDRRSRSESSPTCRSSPGRSTPPRRRRSAASTSTTRRPLSTSWSSARS